MLAIMDYQLLSHSLVVGVLLFVLGVVGFVARRNLIVSLLSAGIILQGITLTLTAFGTFHGDWMGQVFSVLTIVIFVVQGMIGLAMAFAFVRGAGSLDMSRYRSLGTQSEEDSIDAEAESQLDKSPTTLWAKGVND